MGSLVQFVSFSNSAIKTVRKCSDHATTNVSRSFGHNQRRVATDLTLEVVDGNSRTGATAFTSPQSLSANSGKLNPNKEFLFGCSDQTPNNKGRGSPTHPSAERGNYNLTPKKSSSKSAPTSILPSPVVSPRKSYNGNHFVPGLSHHEHQESPSNNSPKVPPLKTALSSQPFPLHSPTARSSISNSRSHNDMTFPLHTKLQKDNSIDRSESHAHVNAHPLPLPPPLVASSQASAQSLPSNVHHVIEKPFISSMKGQWQKGKLIGRGTFGSVYLATNRYEWCPSLELFLYL